MDTPDEDADKPTVLETLTSVVTSVPTPIRKRALKALGRLCAAAIEIPIVKLEGIATEGRAETKARVKLIKTSADLIAEQMRADPRYVQAAIKKFGQKVVREQINLDEISAKAVSELKYLPATETTSETEQQADIDDDWLMHFEKEASQKSTEDMQTLFARILAGEISRPSSFSIRAVRTLGQLDKKIADLFARFCSCCVELNLDPSSEILDARVPSLGKNAVSSGLAEYGFPFSALNALQEHGLIIADYNSWMDYKWCVRGVISPSISFSYAGKNWVFTSKVPWRVDQGLELRGVALTQTGRELKKVVAMNLNPAFNNGFVTYLASKNLELTLVKITS
jgi:hypothetical protein